uniref:flagellar protein FlaG n=1 Tax=Castellaniella defragrans TaxID=75697 RepID=UPI0033413063
MIPPIGHSQTAIATGLAPAAADLPDALPQPAVRLAGVQESSSTGTSTADADTRQPDIGDPSARRSSLDKALESLNSSLEAWATGMRFEMDEDAQRLVVSIIDNTTGEVLRTVPSDAVLRVAKMIVQLQGAGIDTRA